tara:strand:- start:390 stop:1010 length:621 start_codon:yes stop_codon:yes gene_type:complete
LITILDYGLGNIKAFEQVFKNMGRNAIIVSNSEDLKKATKIVLPGVGSFDWAMKMLNNSGLKETLNELVIEKKIDILGVCVGMQIMAKKSEEGNLPGLGWIDAEIKKINTLKCKKKLSLPHMGWNDVTIINKKSRLFKGFDNPLFYFLHSYYIVPNCDSDVAAYSSYVHKFPVSIEFDNIFGTQFHPEKSHGWGEKLLKNFVGKNA